MPCVRAQGKNEGAGGGRRGGGGTFREREMEPKRYKPKRRVGSQTILDTACFTKIL
jgi:hypothetical protein